MNKKVQIVNLIKEGKTDKEVIEAVNCSKIYLSYVKKNIKSD